MYNKFEKIIDSLKKIHLDKNESEKMRGVLLEYAKHLPLTEVQNQRSVKSPYMWWRLFPISIIVVIVIIGNIGSMGKMASVSNTSINFPTMSQDKYSDPVLESSKSSDFGQAENGIYPSTKQMRYYPPASDVTDTRDFLKVNYSSRIETRDVSETVGEIDFIVRDVDGRVDNIQSSKKYGQVSFVIPKSNLFEFKSRIEKITHSQLYTENTSSSNLLYQKQNIEQRMASEVSFLDKLKQDKKVLDSIHNERVNSLNRDIASLESQINAIRALLLNTPSYDHETQNRLSNQLESLGSQVVIFRNNLINENKSYATKSDSLNSKINVTTQNIDYIEKEDLAFENNVETVNGYIDVRWVNLWNFIGAFSPTPMWVNLSVVVLFVWWFLERKRVSREF